MIKCRVCGKNLIRGHKVGIGKLEWLCQHCKMWVCDILGVGFFDWPHKEIQVTENIKAIGSGCSYRFEWSKL